MTQEDKDLLFKDLCARLPYGVKVKVTPVPSEEYNHIFFNGKIISIDIDYIGVLSYNGFVLQQDIIELKPYLFPLSNMTEEQKKELFYLSGIDIIYGKFYTNNEFTLEETLSGINWLLKNHFDINGLIQKGLAIDATRLNIY